MEGVDHLILGCSDLEAGIAYTESLTGVRPAPGGKHPNAGTHNALLSLGPGTYLEILAPDPAAAAVSGFLAGVANVNPPALFTWVVSSLNLHSIDEKLRTMGFQTSGVVDGSRARTDGSILRWKTLRLLDTGDLLIPFLIRWDPTSPHPSSTSPGGCALLDLVLHHPQADRLRSILQVMETPVRVEPAPQPAMTARISTPKGHVLLR